jgi:hypothetical protein
MMDGATNEIYSALLVQEEATASTLRALLEVFDQHGVPLSLYTDRRSPYFHTTEAGGIVDRGQPTQVGARCRIWASSKWRLKATTPQQADWAQSLSGDFMKDYRAF